MRLLFVEDDPFDLDLSVAELRRFGFEFDHHRVDSLEALAQKLESQPWSAVISDYNLPGFTGRDALRVVREHDRDLPFIVLSGNLGEERAVDIIRAGASDYVMKDRIARLAPSLERELRDVQLREERRGLFTALRRSEDRYRRIFETTPVGVAVTTAEGSLITVNSRFVAMLGYSREELLGRDLFDFCVGPQAAAPGEERFEQVYVRKDANMVLASVTVAPIHDDARAVEQLVWLVHDVTEQKAIENELRTHRAQLDEAQRMASIGSYEYDLDTGRRVWSEGLYRIYGLEPGTAADPEQIDECIHRADVERVRAAREVISASQQPYASEYRIVLGTGEPIDALLGQAAEIVTRLLDVECCSIFQQSGPGQMRIVGGIGWSEEIAPGTEMGYAEASQAAYTIETNGPVIVDSMEMETRFPPSPFLTRHGITSSITVPVSTARVAAWGVLGAHTRDSRYFSTADIDFLRSVANVLAQAVERDRVEQQLVLHAAQQSAIAELSRVALKSVDDAIGVACTVVTGVLEVEHSLFFELDEAAGVLRHRAGRSWLPGAQMNIALDDDSPIATAIRGNVPVADGGDAAYGIAGGLVVPVASSGRFGVLTAHVRHTRSFAEADVEFMQSVANILADAFERERAVRALAASEESYREVVEGASEVIFTLSTAGEFTSLNAAFAQITGFDVHEWIGRPFHDLLHPQEMPQVVKLFQSIVDHQRSTSAEMRIVAPKGMVVLDVTSFPKVEDGRTAAVYGFARDVTQTRRDEYERRRLTRSLQLLLESTVEGLVTVDVDGRCTMTNRAAAAMLGRSQDEMSGATLQTLVFGGDASAAEEILAVARSGEVRSFANATFSRANGSNIPVEYSAAPISDGGVRVGVVISFSDITERRKLEVKLEQADRLTSLGRLAATIAHEFNNVLMGISPFIEVVRRGRNVETSLDHIGRAVKRGKRITQDILRFTQPAQPVRAAFDVAPWVDGIMLEAQSLVPSNCSIVTRVDRELRIDGDANQLQQIFTNLILNARDAMPNGGTLTIEVGREPEHATLPFGVVERPECFAHFVVRDTGCGMAPETLRHIFEPLFTTKKNGTGLGLPVAHQVVQRHGGDIFMESAVGIGTTFHIFLPLAEQPADPRAAEVVAEVTALAGVRHVLLVEDDETVAEGLVTLLQLEGLRVDVAGSGGEALLYLESQEPDVVVLDVGLPDMEGTTVYAAIAKRLPQLPVIFSTGHADRGKLDMFLERTNVAFLLKPYDGATLIGTIREVVQ